jgi:dinuclear metal center YbgI/SA1388 family protein
MATVGQVSQFLDSFAPKSLAESWDNVGLIIGDRNATVDRVMTCLTVTPTTMQEAVQQRAGLIVTHHPVLFRPIQRLIADDVQGRALLNLIKADVAIYSPHTAFDSTAGGIHDQLATKLGISPARPLRAQPLEQAKIVVFVPEGDVERVSRAMFDCGAGVIGNYRECSFRAAGHGTFYGSDASHPTVGQPGRREEVLEWRLEVVCPRDAIASIVAAMRKAHSYEEPAYDVYPLQSNRENGGAGRYGDLKETVNLAGFAAQVRSAVDAILVQVIGSPDRQIRRVAVACGSGSDFLTSAVAARCDALMTGEASFHRQLEAEANGIALILAGHYATERFAVEQLAGVIQQSFANIEVWASRSERDPSWVCR